MGRPTGGDIVPKGYELGQLQQFTPEQMQLFQQLFSHVGPESYLSRLAGGDEEMFRQIEKPALRQFGELQGGLASRFSGMGGLGGRKSSGFQNTLTAAGSNLAQDLQSQRQGLQRQALLDLGNMSQMLLGQRPQERDFFQKPQRQNTFLEQLALSLSGGIGQGATQAGLKWLGA
jgi:hypothetical protein